MGKRGMSPPEFGVWTLILSCFKFQAPGCLRNIARNRHWQNIPLRLHRNTLFQANNSHFSGDGPSSLHSPLPGWEGCPLPTTLLTPRPQPNLDAPLRPPELQPDLRLCLWTSTGLLIHPNQYWNGYCSSFAYSILILKLHDHRHTTDTYNCMCKYLTNCLNAYALETWEMKML